VVRRERRDRPNGGSRCQSLRRSDQLRHRQGLFLLQGSRNRPLTSPRVGRPIPARSKLATGWQRHSVRGFLAGVVRKRLNLKLSSKKVDGNRVYQIASGDSGKPTSHQSKRRSR
jgi:Protein of unknown function (DUF3489)